MAARPGPRPFLSLSLSVSPVLAIMSMTIVGGLTGLAATTVCVTGGMIATTTATSVDVAHSGLFVAVSGFVVALCAQVLVPLYRIRVAQNQAEIDRRTRDHDLVNQISAADMRIRVMEAEQKAKDALIAQQLAEKDVLIARQLAEINHKAETNTCKIDKLALQSGDSLIIPAEVRSTRANTEAVVENTRAVAENTEAVIEHAEVVEKQVPPEVRGPNPLKPKPGG